MKREVKQIIIWRKDLKVRKGKIAAQVAHASLGVVLDMMKGDSEVKYLEIEDFLDEWLNGTFTKIVVGCENEEELLKLHLDAEAEEIPTKLITDKGLTEFHGVPTNTCIAIGPYWSDEIDELTKHLKLL